MNLCVEQAECYPIYIRPLVVAAGKGVARLGGRIVDMIAGCFGEEYVSEIRAIAKHADQPLSHVVLGNLMYDGCQMAEIYGAVGCSSYSCNIDGAPTLVRNMDWVWPRSTGRHSRLIRFHRGNDYYSSVSVLGCVGVVSAFSPGKWAVTINQAPTEGTTTSYFQWPVLQRLRNVCDQMGSYRDVVTGLQDYETMTSFFAHVIGTRPEQHTVITGLGDSFRRRGMKGDKLVQTNHFAGHRDLEEHNGPERWEDEEGQEWYCDSHNRAKSLTEGGVSAGVPGVWWRHPAHRVHHRSGADPEDPDTSRRTARTTARLARPWSADRLGRARAGPQRMRRDSDVARRTARDRHSQPLTGSHVTVRTACEKGGFKAGLRPRDKSGLERGQEAPRRLHGRAAYGPASSGGCSS